jgi:hypothetical protein
MLDLILRESEQVVEKMTKETLLQRGEVKQRIKEIQIKKLKD